MERYVASSLNQWQRCFQMKTALPLATRLVTASDRSSNTGLRYLSRSPNGRRKPPSKGNLCKQGRWLTYFTKCGSPQCRIKLITFHPTVILTIAAFHFQPYLTSVACIWPLKGTQLVSRIFPCYKLRSCNLVQATTLLGAIISGCWVTVHPTLYVCVLKLLALWHKLAEIGDYGMDTFLQPHETIWCNYSSTWRRHQMEIFSALLALCEGNPPVTGGLPSQRPVTRNFDVSFDLRLNKRLSKQSRRRWFETPLRSLWRVMYALTPLVV